MLGMGSMGVWLFYLIVGNHSLGLQVSGEVDILGVMAESGGNQAIIAGLDGTTSSAWSGPKTTPTCSP